MHIDCVASKAEFFETTRIPLLRQESQNGEVKLRVRDFKLLQGAVTLPTLLESGQAQCGHLLEKRLEVEGERYDTWVEAHELD